MSSQQTPERSLTNKVVLITGAARRLGAAMADHLHADGANVIIHYRHSSTDADALSNGLNERRAESSVTIQADLSNPDDILRLAESATAAFGQIDFLINNASSFYPTPVGTVTHEQWDDLMSTNLRAPFFLAQALSQELRSRQGAILNMVDIYATRPLEEHPVYCAAKAGLAMMTMSLAKELGPEVRVNGIAPGPVMWPENGQSQARKASIIDSTLLKRSGNPDDIVRAALFLLRDATFTTGQILPVDGGRNLRS